MIQIGQFDVGTAVMMMSHFTAALRVGHMDCIQRIFGSQLKKASLPLVKGNHPELDGSPLLRFDDTRNY